VDTEGVDGPAAAWCRRWLGGEPVEVLFRAGYPDPGPVDPGPPKHRLPKHRPPKHRPPKHRPPKHRACRNPTLRCRVPGGGA
jgi:hypothetical protein